MIIVIVVLVIVVLVIAGLSVRILKQYERGVQFRLGRVKDGARGPGLTFIIPAVDRVRRVSLRIVTLPIQSQGIITKDNVSVDVSAVAYYRVVDPVAAVVAIENVEAAIDQIAQTTLRAVVGRHTLDETLSETDTINGNIREILDVQTVGPEQQLPGLLPEGRAARPTGRNILAAFQGLGLTYTHTGIQLDPLTDTQQHILELLGIQPPWPQQANLALTNCGNRTSEARRGLGLSAEVQTGPKSSFGLPLLMRPSAPARGRQLVAD